MRFRLESILSLKENIEQVKQKELADAYAKKNRILERKQSLEDAKNELNKIIKDSLRGAITPQELMLNTRYIGVLDTQMQQIAAEIVKADAEIEVKRLALVDAMKERKILENLKEMQLEELKKELLLEEQKLTDEIVGYRYIQQERGEDDSGQ
ncbi:flagellar export protein FliJ [Candidatus Epulonipiscium viviparus]|uniref:flagellar export protein FliJ n=1 Tax=Candidatus Epulonipiscium viviparus TaxID=420336 RepID=UPI0004954FA6|nr:flagellar export protein FliJ [Candidatus Epulopiscium viviparus]